MNQLKTSKAFTIIELLVVIVIIGILATVASATFGDSLEKARFAKVQAFAAQVERSSGRLLGSYSFSEGTGATVAGQDSGMPVGTIVGAQWVTDSPSGDGSALRFNGGTNRINFAGDGDENGDYGS